MMNNTSNTVCFFLARELASAVEAHNAIERVRYFTRALLRENAEALSAYGEVFLASVEAGLGGDLYELALASRLVVEEETVFTPEQKAQILKAYDAGLSVDISICDVANIDDAINEWVQQYGANNATKADIDSLMKGKGGTT